LYDGFKSDHRTVAFLCFDNNLALSRHVIAHALDAVNFTAIQAKTFGILAVCEPQWQNAHANQVRAMDAFE
jgi:hypothetical protein